MIKITVDVRGDEYILRAARNLGHEMDRQIKQAIPEIGELTEAFARDMCPVDTGRLRSSIGRFDSAYMVKPNPDTTPEDAIWELGENYVTVGTRVPYAMFVHQNNPWMESAARMIKDTLQGIAEEIMDNTAVELFGQSVSRLAGRIARRVRRRRGG